MPDLKQILKNRPLVISAVLAIAAVFLVQMYLQSQKEQITQQVEETRSKIAVVFVARDTIQAGETIKKDMVQPVKWPINFVQPKAATSIDQIEDRMALVTIEKGEQILMTKLLSRFEGTNLAQITPTGRRAISIIVDNISGLGGMVRPRDYVDVICVLPIPSRGADGKEYMQLTTVTLFQNILVLAVGNRTEPAAAMLDSKKKGAEGAQQSAAVLPVVTLALTPEEANIAAYLQEQQVKLRLALRSPSDAQTTQSLPPMDINQVFKYIYPNFVPPSAEEAPPKPPTVEIQRGTKKEEVIVGGRSQ